MGYTVGYIHYDNSDPKYVDYMAKEAKRKIFDALSKDIVNNRWYKIRMQTKECPFDGIAFDGIAAKKMTYQLDLCEIPEQVVTLRAPATLMDWYCPPEERLWHRLKNCWNYIRRGKE